MKTPEGSWEDFEVYNERKTYQDLIDVIESLKGDGYEAVRLDAYDKDNKFIEHVFVKYFSAQRSLNQVKSFQKAMMDVVQTQVSTMNELLKAQTELIKQISELKKTVESDKMTYVDAISQILYLKELEKTLIESLGLTYNQASNPEVQRFIMELVVDMVKKYMPELERRFRERFMQQHSQQVQQQVQYAPRLPTYPAVPTVPVPEDIERKLNEIAENVVKKVEPPCMREKCEGGT